MAVANDQLALLAELGVAFTGFLAIFLIFARREGRFSPADGVRIRSIIFASFTTVFMALLPLVLVLCPIAQPDLWRLSSIAFLILSLLILIEVGRRQFALSPEERGEIGLLNNSISWGFSGVAVILLTTNALGGFGEPSAAPYVATLTMCLAIAASNFITIAFQRLL